MCGPVRLFVLLLRTLTCENSSEPARPDTQAQDAQHLRATTKQTQAQTQAAANASISTHHTPNHPQAASNTPNSSPLTQAHPHEDRQPTRSRSGTSHPRAPPEPHTKDTPPRRHPPPHNQCTPRPAPPRGPAHTTCRNHHHCHYPRAGLAGGARPPRPPTEPRRTQPRARRAWAWSGRAMPGKSEPRATGRVCQVWKTRAAKDR